MSFSFRQDLFQVKGEPLSFDVSSCYDAEELECIVEFGGGRADNQGGQHTITFLTRNSNSVPHFNPPRDFYSSDFILKCCIRNTILPLKTFLLNESMFTNNFDPNDILLRKMTWKEAQNFRAQPTITDLKTFKNAPGSLKIDGRIPIVQLKPIKISPNEKEMKRFHRHEFSEADRQQIIDFILANPNFSVSNQRHWEEMAKGFSVHTWQSLKGHFRNRIYPSISKYKLSTEIVKGLSKQMQAKRRFRNTSSESTCLAHSESETDCESLLMKSKVLRTSDSSNQANSDKSSPSVVNQSTLNNNEEYEMSGENNGSQLAELTDDGKEDEGNCSIQSSASYLLSAVRKTPSRVKLHAAENRRGTCQPDDSLDNTNQDDEESIIVTSQSSSPVTNVILSEKEEDATQMLSSQDFSLQLDCDEATVSDNFAQTEPVEILPLPAGCEYPTTFADAIKLVRSITIEDDDHPLPAISVADSVDCQVSSAEESFVSPKRTRKAHKVPSRSTKPSSSSRNTARRSPRASRVQHHKKTRSGSLF